MKIGWKESSFCRVTLFLLGITFILGIYSALTVPLFLAAKSRAIWFGGIIGGVLLMIVFHRVIVAEFKGVRSETSTTGQLCVSFLLFMLIQYEASRRGADLTNKYQSSIAILIFVISLLLYIYQKIKGKS